MESCLRKPVEITIFSGTIVETLDMKTQYPVGTVYTMETEIGGRIGWVDYRVTSYTDTTAQGVLIRNGLRPLGGKRG